MYGDPSRDMIVIGVTGTDGKTTTCRMIHHILQWFGKKTVVMGTTWVIIGDKELEGVVKMTSYDPLDLQKLLSQARDAGCTHAVLEVSSHGLVQERFLGISFAVGVLTNITAEHLDYHKTMDSYAEAKKKLFRLVEKNTTAPHTVAVLPQDDSYARQRMEQIHVDRIVDYSVMWKASLSARDVHEYIDHTTAWIDSLGQTFELNLPFVGKFNIANSLAALGVCIGLELEIGEAIQYLQTIQPVEGRQNRLEHNGVSYVIDYAHTPHGLEVMLQWMRACQQEADAQSGKHGRVRCLFGAPGQRDVAKRPDMWRIVEKYADMIILTDDDAGTENRRKILADVKAWISREQGETFFVIPERRDALAFLVAQVKPGDIVLLAGKWHEPVLVTNFGRIPWGEKDVLMEELAKFEAGQK